MNPCSKNRLVVNKPTLLDGRVVHPAPPIRHFDTAKTALKTQSDFDVASSLKSPQPSLDEIPKILIDRGGGSRFSLSDMLTRKWLSQNSSFLFSLVVHLLLLLFLASFVIYQAGGSDIILELLNDRQVETVLFQALSDPLDAALDMDRLDELEQEAILSESVGWEFDQASVGWADHSRSKEETGGQGAAHSGATRASAKFFGVSGTGDRVAYVFDCSGSMGPWYAGRLRDGRADPLTRFVAARDELIRSVESLSPQQEFFVLMFENYTYLMFDGDPQTVPTPIKATDENKERFRKWAMTVVPGGLHDPRTLQRLQQSGKDPVLAEVLMRTHSNPRKCIDLGLKMKPDTLFILSDGAFGAESLYELPEPSELVRSHFATGGKPLKIHTIGFEDRCAEKNLREISELGNGTFTFVTLDEHAETVLRFGTGPSRTAALEHLASDASTDFESKHKFAEDVLIPLLGDDSKVVRAMAEKTLHQFTAQIFKGKIPGIRPREPFGDEGNRDAADPMTNEEVAALWKHLWDDVARSQVLGKPGESAFSDGILLMRLLISGSAETRPKATLEQLKEIPPLERVELARMLIEFQERNRMDWRRALDSLAHLLEKLSENTDRRFNVESFKKFASMENCKRRFKAVLEGREAAARQLYRKSTSVRNDEDEQERFRNELITNFPETEWARQLGREALPAKTQSTL